MTKLKKEQKVLYQFIEKTITLSSSQITQFAAHVCIRLVSQLIKVISVLLQKLLKYISGTATSFTLTVPTLLVLFVNLDLNLYDSKFVTSSPGSSLQYYHKIPVFA